MRLTGMQSYLKDLNKKLARVEKKIDRTANIATLQKLQAKSDELQLEVMTVERQIEREG